MYYEKEREMTEGTFFEQLLSIHATDKLPESSRKQKARISWDPQY